MPRSGALDEIDRFHNVPPEWLHKFFIMGVAVILRECKECLSLCIPLMWSEASIIDIENGRKLPRRQLRFHKDLKNRLDQVRETSLKKCVGHVRTIPIPEIVIGKRTRM